MPLFPSPRSARCVLALSATGMWRGRQECIGGDTVGVLLKLYTGIGVMLAVTVGWMMGALRPIDAAVTLGVALCLMPPFLLFHGAD